MATVRVRVIGDTHLDDKYPGQLEAQIKTLKVICNSFFIHRIVFLGDIFERRQPSPRVLLAFQDFLESIYPETQVDILRGNHDSQTKADDGLTALSLFKSYNKDIITHTKVKGQLAYIPHYEDESRIIEDLKNVGSGAICFGHFGFNGCLNSIGDSDFSIPLSSFSGKTYLGHIHFFNNTNGNVVIVGTPYPTSFNESGKQSYVIDLDNHYQETITPVKQGIRFLTIPISELEEQKSFIEDPNYTTYLRVLISALSEENRVLASKKIVDLIKVPYFEVRFVPTYNDKDGISSYVPDEKLIEISEDIIKDYVKGNSVGLSYDRLMEGYALLSNEIKQDKNN